MSPERSKVIHEEIQQMFGRYQRSRMSIDAVCHYVELYGSKSAPYLTGTFKKDTRPSLRLLTSVRSVVTKTRPLFKRKLYPDAA